MDVAVRWPSSQGRTRKDITWLNFHYWCKRVCEESGYETEYKELWSGGTTQEVLNVALPNLLERIFDNPKS